MFIGRRRKCLRHQPVVDVVALISDKQLHAVSTLKVYVLCTQMERGRTWKYKYTLGCACVRKCAREAVAYHNRHSSHICVMLQEGVRALRGWEFAWEINHCNHCKFVVGVRRKYHAKSVGSRRHMVREKGRRDWQVTCEISLQVMSNYKHKITTNHTNHTKAHKSTQNSTK